MRLMSKISICLIAGLFLLSITGCVQNKVSPTETLKSSDVLQNTFTIATSFYPMFILTSNVAGDIPGVKVVNMSPPQSGCLHDYQLTPNDMKVLERAQALVINGAGTESFMDKVVHQLPALKIVEAGRNIPLIKNEGENEDNPHIWVGISGAIQEVKNIGTQLAALDPAHAEKYRENTGAYVKKIEALDKEMHQGLDGLQNRDIVTFHEAFPYFAKEFNLRIVAIVEREPGSEPSAGELADTIKLIRGAKVKALFAEPQYPAKAAETIARETGARVYTLDPAVSGPMKPDAYETIMRTNLKVLQEALKQ